MIWFHNIKFIYTGLNPCVTAIICSFSRSSGVDKGDCWKWTRVRSGNEPVLFPTGICSVSLFCDGYMLIKHLLKKLN